MLNKYPIYVINLDRDVERFEKIMDQAEKINININRISGILGEDLSKEELNYYCGFDKHYTGELPLSPNEVGCYLSHMRCWEIIKKKSDDYALILEDDVIFNENFKDFLNIKMVKFDILRLSSSKRNSLGIKIKKEGKYSFVHLFKPTALAGAYIITKNAANLCLNKSIPMREPVDHPFFRYYELGHTVLHCLPNPITQSHQTSNIETERKEKKHKVTSSKSISLKRSLQWAIGNFGLGKIITLRKYGPNDF